MDSMYTYTEVAVENNIRGRSYVEVVGYADGTIHLGAEDDEDAVDITMTSAEAQALIEHLTAALSTVVG